MPVNVIGTLKPKNNGKFPVAEAVDIKVTENLRLDEALENKADLETLNYALANKADKTTTTSLQNQINEIIAPATQDAEVQNARIDAEGVTHSTLKERIDSTETELKSYIDHILNGTEIENNKDLRLEQGNITSTGSKASRTDTVRTSQKIAIQSGDTLIYDNSVYKVDMLGYTNAGDDASAVETGYVSVSPVNLAQQINKPYLNLNIRRIDGADLTPTEATQAVTISASVPNNIAYVADLQAGIQEAKDYSDAISQNFLSKTTEKNKFNKNAPAVSGKYVAYSTGEEHTNADFNWTILPCAANADYAVNRGYIQIAFYSEYPDQLQGYISGAYDTAAFTFHTPANALYMTVSFSNAMRDTLQIEYGTTSTEYEDYTTGLAGSEIQSNSIGADKLSFDIGTTTYNEIVVDINGSGDYTSLRSALESINNSSAKNQFIVKIKEGIYDIAADYTAQEWAVESDTFKGLFVPDYTTLVGIGNKENVIITASDITQREYISTLNLKNTSSLKNLTVRAKNLRYTIHDDMATAQNGYERVIENCDFYGETLQRTYVYGCGIKQNADLKFKNCNFTTDATQNFSFLIHNNTNWNDNSKVLIENCRFMPYDTSYGVILSSLNTGAKLTYVELIGNKMKRLRLNENNAASYGAGIQFKVKGYANSITDEVEIIHTDDHDYLSYVDLI